MLVVDGFGHERDSQDDDTGDDKQDDGEVEVVDSTYDGGTVTGIDTAACPISKLGYHPGQADQQSDGEAVKCTLRKERSLDECTCIKTVIVRTWSIQQRQHMHDIYSTRCRLLGP